jgi:hypothetical protein
VQIGIRFRGLQKAQQALPEMGIAEVAQARLLYRRCAYRLLVEPCDRHAHGLKGLAHYYVQQAKSQGKG